MGANPHANGLLKKPSSAGLQAVRDQTRTAWSISAENTRPLGIFLRDVIRVEHAQLSYLWP
jgi:phosphoketolase